MEKAIRSEFREDFQNPMQLHVSLNGPTRNSPGVCHCGAPTDRDSNEMKTKQKGSTMKTRPCFRALSTLGLLSAVLMVAASTEARQQPGFNTTVKPYAVPVSPEYAVKPIISVGDRVPLTSDSSKQFQMIGIPDGMGAYRIPGGSAVVYMNHEVGATAISEPVIGAARYRGAFVSKFTLNAKAEVLSGDRNPHPATRANRNKAGQTPAWCYQLLQAGRHCLLDR